jgi:hypothetical protein
MRVFGANFELGQPVGPFVVSMISAIVPMFTNAAIMTIANARLEGRDATVGDGLRCAARAFPRLLGWWTIAAAVGAVLQLIASKLPFGARIASVTLGLTWNLATVFVIPVLLFEPVTPVQAVRRSASLFKQRWGESVAGYGGLGIAAMLLMVMVILIATPLLFVEPIAYFAVYAVGFIIVMTVGMATGGVFTAALYRFATAGDAPGPFDRHDLEASYKPKRRRRRPFGRG